ncbi:transmembrane protease serine 9-like [Cloeon dipterum]|uniref:transmembrane protease serine 9-like n=1 Tax=Cloeon dipterum TaxID=197152 RepID=UPI00321F858A
MKVGLSLIIFLSSAFCVARCSTFSAPYFEDGENLSYKDCGVWDRSSANRSSWIAILVQNQKQCFGIVISPRAILTLECEINMEEKENIQAFVGDCGTVYSRNETACTNQTIEVQDVIELNKNPRAAERVLLHLIITKKMSSISPICLFNRAKYSDVVEQTNKNYFALQRWQNPQEKQSWDNLAPRQIVPFENCFSNSSNLTELYEKLELAPQSLLCVRASDNFNDISLVNSYKQRYFLRGLRVNHGLLKEPSNHRIIIDILPYIDMIAKYTKDIPVLPRIPPAHPKKGLNKKSLSFPKCGLTPDALENNGGKLKSEFGETQRLYGGYDSRPDAHPWHAQVENIHTISICGGTLISTKAVLTAAHCIFGLNASDFDVTIGVYDRKSSYSPKIQINTPSRLISHPNYTSGQFHYDIGLMIFDEEQFNITEHVRPICLWNEDASLERVSENQAVVIGFGITDSNKTLPETLQEAKLQIRSHKVCYLSNRRFFQKYLKPGDNFCAGYTNGTTACHGDSGGSLSLEKNGRWFIRGIVSFGMSKKSANASGGAQETVCNPNSYSLFTDVANYMDWILENAPEVYEYYEEETLQTSIFPDFSWSVLILALVIIFFVYILFKYN